ncbi:HI1506-related protein [Cupriavidus sp. BIC8F]|uniref:HI1506-related protein n=1 Tax=Cupriavidus sp. BIC8F TaxID=3079014 RepID=UPI0029162254|nr:HI1506-related protein [Cupriavidus sp. BIC8F]
MATKKVKVLRVVSRKDKFRRAGFEFSADPQNLPLDTLSADQLAAIKGDPSLVAIEAEVVIDEEGNVVEAPQGEGTDAEPSQAEIAQAKAHLQEWANELNKHANELTVREDQVKAREEALAAAEAALTDREAGVAAREAAADQAAGQGAAKTAGKGGK